jgi:WD40 repeat protein
MNPQPNHFQPPGLVDSYRLRRTWRFFRGLPERLTAFLFGDDVFVSYARGDGATYAAALASKLTKAGFSCFLDQWSAGQGEALPKYLVRAVRRSSAFVLLATRQSLDSQFIREELEAFSGKQPLILVQLTESIDGSRWSNLVAGVAKTIDVSEHGRIRPSRDTVDRIVNSFRTRSRNKRLRTTFFAVLLVTTGLVALSAWYTAQFKTAAAEAQKRETAANQRVNVANEREDAARRAESKARNEAATADASRSAAVVQALAARAAYGATDRSVGPESVSELAAESVLRRPTALASQVLLDNVSLIAPTVVRAPVSGNVTGLAFTMDGVRAAIQRASEVEIVEIRGTRTFRRFGAAASGSVPSLSDDGQHLAMISTRGVLSLSSEAGTRGRTVELPANVPPNGVALSRDGTAVLVTGTVGAFSGPPPVSHAAVCDGTSDAPCHVESYPNTYINAAVSPNGTELAVAGSNFVEVIQLKRAGSRKRLPLTGAQSPMFCSRACKKVAVTFSRSMVIWDTNADRTVIVNTGGKVRLAQISPDGARLATVSWVSSGAVLQIWDTFDGTEIARFVDPYGIDAIALEASAQRVAFAVEGWVNVCDLNANRLRPLSVPSSVFTLTASNDGTRFVIGSFGAVDVFDRAKNSVNHIKLDPIVVEDAAISRDGRVLVLGGGKLLFVQPQGGFELRADFGARGEVGGTIGANRLSPDGRFYVTTGARTLRVHSTRTDDIVLGPLPLNQDVVTADFSPDGNYIAVGGVKQAEVWNISSKKLLRAIPGWTTFLALSNEGRTIARSGGGTRADVINVGTGKTVFTIEDPNPRRRVPLIQFRFSEDGSKLYVPTMRSGLSEFDLKSGAERRVYTLGSDPDPATGLRTPVTISANARFVAWANGNIVRIAPIDSVELAREACGTIKSPITPEEWSYLAPGEARRLGCGPGKAMVLGTE